MPPSTVLVVDDDPNIQQLMRLYLEQDGFTVVVAGDGVTAIDKHNEVQPELLVLDIMLPGRDGWDVCREIRKDSSTPIIMLSARGEDYDKILGLELGADDYLTKPFNPRELVARVRAILRRSAGAPIPADPCIDYPDLSISRSDYGVRGPLGQVSLTAKEFEILWLLMESPRQVFTREMILDSVWGFDHPMDVRTVDTHIKRIRRKLGPSPGGSWEIKTVWGVGYRFQVHGDRRR